MTTHLPQERSESTYYLHLPSIIIKHDDENPHVFYMNGVFYSAKNHCRSKGFLEAGSWPSFLLVALVKLS